MCAWDHFLVCQSYPGPGEYTVVSHEFQQAGGTTSNTCAALGQLGIQPMFASCVGADQHGHAIIESLIAAGCNTEAVIRKPNIPTDRSVIIISGEGDELDRTIFWIQGAKPVAGEQFPVDRILNHRWVLLDVDDANLRRFWLDLPAHRSPRTRLIGTMVYLVEMDRESGWDHALRHDVLLGNSREFLELTGCADLDSAIEKTQREMAGNACSLFLVTLGAGGAIAIRQDSTARVGAFDVEVKDTTGAGDAFAAGCIWGLLEHADDREVLRRGNLLGGLACTAFGARAGLPSLEYAVSALDSLRPKSVHA